MFIRRSLKLKKCDSSIELVNEVPFSPMRQVIASRMVEAAQSIPHFRVVREIEVDSLLKLCREINKHSENRRVSINDFIVKACAQALIKNPKVNCHVFDNSVHQFSQADISVVVAVEGGLLTPVIRHADGMSITEISKAIRELTIRAARGKLKMSEITGGSFSISNIGKHSVDQFDAIINPPQAAILAVGSAMDKAVVKEGRVVIRTIIRVSLSLDHRAVDGVDGAVFLDSLSQLLENPELLMEKEVA